MKELFVLVLLASGVHCYGQKTKVHALQEQVVIPVSSDGYKWESVLHEWGRTLFNNSVACSDSVMYSMGGFNTIRVQREMNSVRGKRLVREPIDYPGEGFMNNLFFVRDTLLYVGGGHDSGKSLYSSTDFWVYRLGSKTWIPLNPLPFRYIHPVHVFGYQGRTLVLLAQLEGEQLHHATPILYEYDLNTDKWMKASERLAADRLSGQREDSSANWGLRLSAFQIDKYIYVLFQRTSIQDNTTKFFAIDMETGQWKELPPFPGSTQKLNAAFAVSDGVYGYIGGGMGKLAGNSKEVFRYDPELAKWERIKDLPLGVRYAKGWQYKGETYVGFGINDKHLTVKIWKLKRRR